MQLTKQELGHISPGIYRTSHLPYGSPNLKDPNNDGLIKELKGLTTSADPDKGKYKDFYKSPDEFLDTWIKGYLDFPDTAGKFKDESHLLPLAKGFELFYVNWHPEDPHYRVGGRELVFNGSRLEYIMLASDINGMNDQKGYMNVGVNDFENERILVWRGKDDKIRNIPYQELPNITKKTLRDDISFYVWDYPEEFPFHSPNLLKSYSAGGYKGTWIMIGFNPEDVYAKFKELGFVFPPVMTQK